MQSVVELSRLEVAARTTTSTRSSLFQALRRIVRLDFLSFEDEIGRAIDRAFAELAREMRK